MMKKTLIIFIIILSGVFAILSFLDRHGDYAAERNLWKINQDFYKVTRDPKTTPDITFDQITARYEKFLQRFSYSRLAPAAYIRIGRVYLFRKNYNRARQEFENVIQKFSDKSSIVVQGLKEIIYSYEKEEDLDNVIKVHQRAKRDYPLTSLGLDAPFLMAKVHAQQKREDLAKKDLFDAIKHYKQLIQQYPDTPVEFKAQELLARCFFSLQMWREAVNTLGEIFIRFSEPPYLTPSKAKAITKSINTVSVFQLRDADLPISIYQKFMGAHPQHPFNKVLNNIIQELKQIKENKKDFLNGK